MRAAPGQPCPFCGTVVPQPVAEVGGPALCVCRVQATWRCHICDTPICGQHRDRFWPGQAHGNVRLNDRWEEFLWGEATGAPSAQLHAGAPEACTVCRARAAGSMVDRYRAIPRPMASDSFNRLLSFQQAQLLTPRMCQLGDPGEMLHGTVGRLAAGGHAPTTIATSWRIRNGHYAKTVGTGPVWTVPLRGRTQVLLVPTDALVVAGPLTLLPGKVPYPAPDAIVGRDVARTPKPPRSGPPGDSADYQLHWRPPGSTAQDLGLQSFWDLVGPVAG